MMSAVRNWTKNGNMGAYLAVVATRLIFAVMLMLSKVVFDGGMNMNIFVFYRQVAATLFLLPFALFYGWKSAPPLSFKTFCKIFLLSFVGITLSLTFNALGIAYTTSTIAAASVNLIPVITFFLAVILRMELLKWRSKSGIAKVAGIIFCIGGVAILAFYKGPGFQIIPLENQLVSARRIVPEVHHSTVTWLKGCFSLVACSFFFASWIVFQGNVLKEYPSKILFTSLQCFLSMFQSFFIAIIFERDLNEWKLGWNFRLLSVVYCMESETQQSVNYPHQLEVRTQDTPQPSINETETRSGSREPSAKKKRSLRAEHWEGFTEYRDESGLRARCKYCPANYAADPIKNGTKNLKIHFSICKENPANMSKGKQTKLVLENIGNGELKMKNWSFDTNAMREAIVLMVIKDEMPFKCVEKEGLKNVIFAACPLFKMPSRTTIQRDCLKLYFSERDKLKEFFGNACQGVCVTTDTWTSSAMDNYMCVTAHFVDNEWNLQKRIINFCKINSHKGQDLGKALEDCLRYWNLDKKLLTVTVDNASANDVACTYMSEIAKGNGCITEGKYLHFRCMAHILNLIVQDGIKQCGGHVDKLRAVIKYIRGSTTRLHAFKQQAEKCKVACSKSLTLDVCTRWNSTYDMLSSALPYKSVFSRMEIPCLDDSDLGPLSISDWSKIEVLTAYLKEFYELTHCISGSLYVTSNFMIFHIAKVVEVLTNLSANGDPTLNLMASEMKKKCDKYWGSFDKFNLLMLVPTILDPSFKLDGLRAALEVMFVGVDLEKLVDKVKDYSFELFDQYASRYAILDMESEGGVVSNSTIESGTSSWIQKFTEKLSSGNMSREDIANRAEFDSYLRGRKESTRGDVLKWWKLNAHIYPILSRMARDVLAIPISTVPSESTFSTGGRHLTSSRSRLTPKIVQALVCTQDWLNLRTTTMNKDDDEESGLAVHEEDDEDGVFYA